MEGLRGAAKSGVIGYGNVLNENTPIRGVFVYFLIFSSLCGGYKSGRPEFIPVYQICTPPDKSDCGCEAENI